MDKRTRIVITAFLGVILLVTLTMLLVLFLVIIPAPAHSSGADNPSRVPRFEGLTIHPEPNAEGILHFREGRDGNWTLLAENIDTFLKTYYQPLQDVSYRSCYYNYTPNDDRVCRFTPAGTLGYCSADNNNFGYLIGKPCVLIQINPDVGWVPDNYDIVGELPVGISPGVKLSIDAYAETLPKDSPSGITPTIISCDGMVDQDKKHIGTVSYYPSMGYPGYYYPRRNVKGYVLPAVAVRFEGLPRGVTVTVQCRVFARNISSNWGYANFRIRVD